MASSADIWIAGIDMAGTIDVEGDMSGMLRIDTSLASTGSLLANSIDGTVYIDADVNDVGQWLGSVVVNSTTITPAAYYCDDASIGGGSIVVKPVDCDDNSSADICEIVADSDLDCNSNDAIDSCCRYDLDGSGYVGVGDINLIKANMGACDHQQNPETCGCRFYDLDDSEYVGVGDINLIKASMGPCS